MDRGVIDLECQYCRERCFLPLLELWLAGRITMLAAMAYVSRGVNMVATCEAGRAMEKSLFDLRS
jgi:hypothetical protein